MIEKSFGKRLRFLRELAGFTQAALAEKAGISEQYLGRVERGLSSPSFTVMGNLAESLDVDLASLFLFSEGSKSGNEAEHYHSGPECNPLASNGVCEPAQVFPVDFDWTRYIAHIGTWESSLDCSVSSLSPSLVRLLGYAAHASTKAYDLAFLKEHMDEEYRGRFESYCVQLADTGKESGVQLRINRKDGEVRTVLVKGWRRDNASSSMLLGVVSDITDQQRLGQSLQREQSSLEMRLFSQNQSLYETRTTLEREVDGRKSAEHQTRYSRELMQGLLDASSESMLVLGADMKVLVCNAAGARRIGLDLDEIIGAPLKDILSEEIYEQRRTYHQEVVESGESRVYIEHWQEGVRETTLHPVFGEDGVVDRVAVFSRDITSQVNLEAELRSSRDLLQSVLDSVDLPFYVRDGQSRYVLVNRKYATYFGVDRDRVVGQTPFDVFDEALASRIVETDLEAYEEGKAVFWERSMPHNGSMLMVQSYKSPWIGDGGRKLGICGFIIDLRNKESMSLGSDGERFLRHDLRGPLGTAFSAMSLMQDGCENSRCNLGVAMRESLGRVMILLDVSRTLTQIEQGTYAPKPEPFDVLGVLKSVQVDVLSPMENLGVKIRILVEGNELQPDDCVQAHAVESLSYPVFLNLVKNAVESAEDDVVTIDVAAGSEIVVSIRNSGVIPEEIRDRLYEKYATRGKSGGIGFGTYIARVMTLAQNGEISISSSIDSGTVATVRLPAAN